MGKQKTKHVVGGSKEAAIVGSSALVGDPSHEQTYTSEDEEFQSYSKFLKGLFKKLSRWQVVLRTQGNQGDNNWQWLRVYSSSNGLDVSSKMTGEGEYPPDTVLVSGSDHWNTPEIGNVFFYWFRRGFAGENFFVDPEGKPLI